MRGSGLLLAFLLLIPASCTPPARSPAAGVDELDPHTVEKLEADVRQTLSELAEAMNRQDSAAVLAHYRAGEGFAYVGCTEVVLGWESYATRARIFYAAHPEVTFELEVLKVQVLGPTVAVATVRGSSTEEEALFWTEVMVRGEDGQWRIAHEHESWPGCPPPPPPHPFTGTPSPS